MGLVEGVEGVTAEGRRALHAVMEMLYTLTGRMITLTYAFVHKG